VLCVIKMRGSMIWLTQSLFLYLLHMKKRHTQEQRNQLQLIRRRMIQKTKPSGKVYSRKKNKTLGSQD